MRLLDRLNVFRRVKNLETQEAQLLESLDVLQVRFSELELRYDDMESGVECIVEYMGRREQGLRELNAKLHDFTEKRIGSLDIYADLDVIEKDGA